MIYRVNTGNLNHGKYINLFNIWAKTGDNVNDSPYSEALQESLPLRFLPLLQVTLGLNAYF